MTATVKKNSTAMALLKSSGVRTDRWENTKNNFGGSKDPTTNTRYNHDARLSRDQLNAMFIHDWLTRRAVEIPAKDATREWITLTHKSDPAKAEKVRDEVERLQIREKVEEAEKLARLYGGNIMTIGAFDGNEMETPMGAIRSVEFFNNTDRFLSFPQSYHNDPMELNYGQPETYLIHRLQVQGSLTIKVHESRTIRFDGNYLPQIERMRNYGWGESVVTNMYSAIRDFGIANQSGAAVLQDFVTKKMKIENLSELLDSDEGENAVFQRVFALAQLMSMHNVAVFGADEEFEKMGTPITGLSELMERYNDLVSAACEIPKARLFHNHTGILGGDAGGNDLRVHYDNIKAYQENSLRPKLRKIIDVISEPLGLAAGEVDFTFNPLWQLSETDEAEVRLKTAQTDEIYIRNNVVHPEEVAVSRFGGDGVNLTDMVIDVDRRTEYLETLSKQKIEDEENEKDKENKITPEEDQDAIDKE